MLCKHETINHMDAIFATINRDHETETLVIYSNVDGEVFCESFGYGSGKEAYTFYANLDDDNYPRQAMVKLQSFWKKENHEADCSEDE